MCVCVSKRVGWWVDGIERGQVFCFFLFYEEMERNAIDSLIPLIEVSSQEYLLQYMVFDMHRYVRYKKLKF